MLIKVIIICFALLVYVPLYFKYDYPETKKRTDEYKLIRKLLEELKERRGVKDGQEE